MRNMGVVWVRFGALWREFQIAPRSPAGLSSLSMPEFAKLGNSTEQHKNLTDKEGFPGGFTIAMACYRGITAG